MTGGVGYFRGDLSRGLIEARNARCNWWCAIAGYFRGDLSRGLIEA